LSSIILVHSQVGLHVWLPMAMEGPTPVSALIHAATMVTAGVYLLIRSSPLFEYSSVLLLLCLWLGAITTVFSSLIGLFQQDIKKVIAYSTMSQLGMMVIAVGLSSYNLALFHLINHAFYKGLLFLGAGSVIHGVLDNQDFRKYGGLIHFLPLSYSVMLIASLSLVAFPFMAGFYSKDFILESAYGQYNFSSLTVYIIATIGAIFTTLYSIKVLYLTFLTNPNGYNINYKISNITLYYLKSKIRIVYNSLLKTRKAFHNLGAAPKIPFWVDVSLEAIWIIDDQIDEVKETLDKNIIVNLPLLEEIMDRCNKLYIQHFAVIMRKWNVKENIIKEHPIVKAIEELDMNIQIYKNILNVYTNPNFSLVNYGLEGNILLTLPLIILAVFSIIFGYITKDIFIGLGTNFFVDNSIFIHPINEITINTEFAVPLLYKLLPFILTVSFSLFALFYSELFSFYILLFKLSKLGYYIFGFFNQRFYIELIYNKYIVNFIFNLGGQTTRVLDRGSIELLGPFGLEKGLILFSKNIAILSTNIITTYALFNVIAFIGFLCALYILSNNYNYFSVILISILIFYFLGNLHKSFFSKNISTNKLESSFFKKKKRFTLLLISIKLTYHLNYKTFSTNFNSNSNKFENDRNVMVHPRNLILKNLHIQVLLILKTGDPNANNNIMSIITKKLAEYSPMCQWRIFDLLLDQISWLNNGLGTQWEFCNSPLDTFILKTLNMSLIEYKKKIKTHNLSLTLPKKNELLKEKASYLDYLSYNTPTSKDIYTNCLVGTNANLSLNTTLDTYIYWTITLGFMLGEYEIWNNVMLYYENMHLKNAYSTEEYKLHYLSYINKQISLMNIKEALINKNYIIDFTLKSNIKRELYEDLCYIYLHILLSYKIVGNPRLEKTLDNSKEFNFELQAIITEHKKEYAPAYSYLLKLRKIKLSKCTTKDLKEIHILQKNQKSK
jgi:NADH:ubiquinone oxidoreductase subunit 5 (subunit L)/multisubunit Na+/H+ antiporter MnhA subunit